MMKIILLFLLVCFSTQQYLFSEVTVSESKKAFTSYNYESVLLPAAPWERCYPYPRLDVEGSDWESISKKDLKTIILENEYLKITIIPELGGRIYSAIFKSTGKEIFFNTDVIKPCDLNGIGSDWTCMIGGLKYSFPEGGHSPNDITPWKYEIIKNDEKSISVKTFDTDLGSRMKISETVTLKQNTAVFELFTELENPTEFKNRYCYWNCAQLNHKSDTRFIFPTNKMIIHTDGWGFLTHSIISWPVYKGQDLSYFKNWREHEQGLFPQDNENNFVGTYDLELDQGLVRVYPSETVKGTKVWCFNRLDPPYEDYFDSDIMYYELFGGVTETQEEYTYLEPKSKLAWTEYWYPIKNTGGFVYAVKEMALNLAKEQNGDLKVSLAAAVDLQNATIQVFLDDVSVFSENVNINPSKSYKKTLQADKLNKNSRIKVICSDENKKELLKYETNNDKI